jgi:hypothetical protein
MEKASDFRSGDGMAKECEQKLFYLHDDPEMYNAWAPWFSHEYITYLTVQAIEQVMSLPPVEIKANPIAGSKSWPVGPDHKDLYRENYRILHHLDPLWSFNYGQRNAEYSTVPPVEKCIEPRKILVLYSTEPDLYLDYDLHLHKSQKLTGGSHGWRHMRFKVLGTCCGMAPESFQVNADFSQRAFTAGNDYWGWRYLSRAGHYLADLGNPFHVKVLPHSFMVRNIFSSSEWFAFATCAHQSYEVYVERRFREGFSPFRDALLEGAREGQESKGAISRLLSDYIRDTEKRHSSLFYFFKDQFGTALLDIFQKLDPEGTLDVAAQTNMCSAETARVIFHESNLPALAWLDAITAEILRNVGRMLGSLFGHAGFGDLSSKNLQVA